MLEKFGLPEKCLQDLDFPLDSLFPNYHIKDCTIYALINSDVLATYNLSSSDYYSRIGFIHIKLAELDDYKDLYNIARGIISIFKYSVVIIFELDGMYKLEISLIEPDKIHQGDNIIKHMLLSQWIYDDQETVETDKFFKEIASLIEKNSDIYSLYKSYFKAISLIDGELIPISRAGKLIRKILSKNIDKENLTDKILKNLRIFTIRKQNGKTIDIEEFYAPECVWHSMNKLEEVRKTLEKENIHDMDAFLRCDDGELVGAQEYIAYWGPDDQDDWDSDNYSDLIDKYHGILSFDNSDEIENDILKESKEWDHLDTIDKNHDEEE